MNIHKDQPEMVFHGVPASQGLAHGPAFVFLKRELEVPLYEVAKSREPSEIKRLEQAIDKTREQITELRQKVAENLGEQEAQIFDAHILVLEDKALIDETIREHQKTLHNIDYCFRLVSQRYIEAFDQIHDEYIKERAIDIRDVSRRVLNNLLGQNQLSNMPFDEQKIIISEDLSPSDIADIQKEMVLAVLTNAGSRTSHSAIMARSLQVPAVVGLHDITERVENDDYLIVDGYEGTVIVNPSPETLLHYGQVKRKRQSIQKVFDSVNTLPAKTNDNHRLKLQVNIEGTSDLRKTYTMSSDGVGLFRTEALFLRAGHPPSEDEQYKVYKNVVEAMNPQTVTIRTIDLGGDKRLSNFFVHEKEENPFMGFRAIRLCLEHIDLFKTQLRAILRASPYGKVQIMYPMITDASEIEAANKILNECKQELKSKSISFDNNIPIGSMIETPAAALVMDLLSEHCSFFSIGTNDLIQYILAVDRVNDNVAHLYQPYHPAVIRLLRHIINIAQKKNKPISVCGEMAGDPLFASLLIGLGITNLSVTPSALPELKYLIRHMKLSKAKALAEYICTETQPTKILKLLREFYLNQMGSVFKEF